MGETNHLIIGHRRPDFSYPQPWRFVTDQPNRNDDFQVPPGTSDRNLPDDSVIGEYHYLFKVADSLSSSNPSSQIRIAQYRRLVVNKPVGTPSTNQPWTRIVTPRGADALSLNELTEPDSSGFLLSSVLPVHSIIRDFGASHPSRDLFRFLSDCVDAGLLTSEQLTEIAEFNALIPAPSNGTFPTEFFIRSMALLRRAAVAFCQSGYSPSTGYNQRCVAFCLERLNSCLIFIELARLNIDVRKVVGHQVTISETAAVSLTGR